ncbi:anthrone oxygenase family protein [Amycolatopsis sp. NPDC059021]|uniref:anthrone oxygenase family protein n=1 Tax=Amycolatopsis sp. NPDC059021 TaxID=3346704 RepID=UPI00366C911A
MYAVLLPLVLLANGLSAGVLVGTQLGGWPLLARLPPEEYVRAHAFFATRFDPFMPVCLVLTVLGDGVLAVAAAVRRDYVSTALFGGAAVLALCTIVISLTKNVPVNRWVSTLDPQRLPPDFSARDPRRHWGPWNRARFRLSTLALAANCFALGLLL